MRIAVDAMGGDFAPRRPVDGALAAARHLGVGIDLIGRASAIRDELIRHPDAARLDVRVVDAPDVLGMDESAAQARRRKPHSSIMVATARVASGEAAAVVSAGHTGGSVVAAHTLLGMLDGIAVWNRELRRPVHERSPGVIALEETRAARIAAGGGAIGHLRDDGAGAGQGHRLLRRPDQRAVPHHAAHRPIRTVALPEV